MFENRFHFILAPALVVAALFTLPGVASAQWHGRVAVGVGFYSPFYYGPYGPYGPYGFYGPFYSPWYGYGPWGPWPYGGYYAIDEFTSSVRLEVTPRKAEVFVDGYRAGTIDDFDGFFQRLRIRPGQHDIVLYLDGYRTVHQRIAISHGADQKIRYTMVPLPAGETTEGRPEPPPPPPPSERQDQPQQFGPRNGPGPGAQRMPQGPMPPQGQGMPQQEVPRNPAPAPSDARYGSVSIRVQPADADVTIDGERWSSPASQDRLVVQLAEGRHHVEVKKEGFDQYSGDVQVRRGETVTLNISLLRRSSQE